MSGLKHQAANNFAMRSNPRLFSARRRSYRSCWLSRLSALGTKLPRTPFTSRQAGYLDGRVVGARNRDIRRQVVPKADCRSYGCFSPYYLIPYLSTLDTPLIGK